MPQEQYQVKQGADKKLLIEVVDNGTIQDFTSSENVKVELFVRNKREDKFILYALNADAGEKSLTIDPTTKKLILILEGSDSRLLPTGTLVASVKAWIPDVDIPDGNREVEYGLFMLGTVIAGNMKDVDI